MKRQEDCYQTKPEFIRIRDYSYNLSKIRMIYIKNGECAIVVKYDDSTSFTIEFNRSTDTNRAFDKINSLLNVEVIC